MNALAGEMTRKRRQIFFDTNNAGPLILFCISLICASSALPEETCEVDIAGYCCRNDTLLRPSGFELSCFSEGPGEDGIIPSQDSRNVGVMHDLPALPENPDIKSRTRSLAFRIKVVSGSKLTVRCATAAPNVPSLLTYLMVQSVTDLTYMRCDVPKGNLSFAEIFEGNLVPVNSMKLEDPLNIPNRTLRRDLFDGLSAGLRSLTIAQDVENESIDLADGFFASFQSLRTLNLTASITGIPAGLDSLSNLTGLYLSSTGISEIQSEAFSGLTSLDVLQISNAPIAEFGSKPFSDLKMLTGLKMSGFHITVIQEDIFSGLSRLKVLEMREWLNLTTVPAGIFKNTPTLRRLTLGTLPLLETLPEGIFKKLRQLQNLHISECGLKHLPTGLWPQSGGSPYKVKVIYIENNELEALPQYFFRGTKMLKDLSLERNRLSKIGKSLQKVSSLRKLNLYGNRLASISEGDLKDLNGLQYLNLSNNGIEFIEHGSFENLYELQTLILSNNKLQSFDNLITANNEAIGWLYLSNNKITSFPDLPFDELEFLDILEMDDNLVSTFDVPLFGSDDTAVYLRRNRIELILFSQFDDLVEVDEGEHFFHIDWNPFKCNGENFDFLRYIKGQMVADIAMFENLDNCFCNGTSQLVKTVDLGELFNEVENCPKPCMCRTFPFNNSTVVRCDNKNLSSIPILPPKVTELNFEGNCLETFPNVLATYESLRIVNLKKNRLRSIDQMFSFAPPNLQLLYVESNQLERLNVEPKTEVRYSVALSDNPWICDCDAKNFKSFLDENAAKISDYPTIKCDRPFEVDGVDEFSLSRIPLDIMCPFRRPIVLIVVSCVVTAFGLALLIVILVLKNRILVTAFIYVHFNALFQLLSTESDPDETREYDAFLSYAASDREIAIEILNKLESVDADSPKHLGLPYKLCFHERDFVAGQSINWNIHKAVKSSHRTIFILSQEFLESSWSTLEFETAYSQMLDDHTSRLIIIIKGDISKFKNLNENVQAVLSTRTYLIWGERWFWKKLFYAMPHTNRTRGKVERF